MQPFLKWPGSKRALLPELHARMPSRYGRYFEPFLGSGALYFSLQPKRAYLSDINWELINTYRTIRDHPIGVAKHLQKCRSNRPYFERIRRADRRPSFKSWTKTRRAARMIYLNKTCFHGLMTMTAKGYLNVSYGHYAKPRFPTLDELKNYSEAMDRAEFGNHCYTKILQRVRKGDFVYLDPPYDGLPVNYGTGQFPEAMQLSLLGFCRLLDQAGAYFMMSNANVPRVRYLFFDYNIGTFPVNYNFNGEGGRKTRELLITNYD